MIELAAVAGATIGAYLGARHAVSSKLRLRGTQIVPLEGVGSSSPASSRGTTRSRLAKAPEDNVRVYGL